MNLVGYENHIQGYQIQTWAKLSRRDWKPFSIREGGVEILKLTPSKRRYTAPEQTTTEAGIYWQIAGDLYIVLGDPLKDGAYSVRVYFNPLVRLIWIGTIIMFLGGLLSFI